MSSPLLVCPPTVLHPIPFPLCPQEDVLAPPPAHASPLSGLGKSSLTKARPLFFAAPRPHIGSLLFGESMLYFTVCNASCFYLLSIPETIL
jgi:hypothetical protein